MNRFTAFLKSQLHDPVKIPARAKFETNTNLVRKRRLQRQWMAKEGINPYRVKRLIQENPDTYVRPALPDDWLCQ